MRMKKTWIILILLLSGNVFAQSYRIPSRFSSDPYFQPTDIQVDTNISYKEVTGLIQPHPSSNFNIFYPKLSIDTLKGRPFILLIHGGGFQMGDKRDENDLCQMLAEKGFVAATINYRLNASDQPGPTLEQGYMAQQDANAALKYFRLFANKYGIDTNCIFIGGESAGAITALGVGFISQEDWNQRVPGIEKKLGSLNNHFLPAGIIDMWGAIGDTAYISNAEANKMPILMFHGTEDMVCPFGMMGPPLLPEKIYGSEPISIKYKNAEACYHLYTKFGAGHGMGFSREFLAGEIACFVKAVVCHECISLQEENVDNQVTCYCCGEMKIVQDDSPPPKHLNRLLKMLFSLCLITFLPVIIGFGIVYIKRKKGSLAAIRYVKTGMIVLAAISIAGPAIINVDSMSLYTLQDHSGFIILLLMFLLMYLLPLVALFILVKKHWKEKTKGFLYWLSFAVYTILMFLDFNAQGFFIENNMISNIIPAIQSLPIIIVIAGKFKNYRSTIKLSILLGVLVLTGGILYDAFFVGASCAFDSNEAMEQMYYRRMIAQSLFNIGMLFMLAGIGAAIERRVIRSTGS